MVQRVSVILDHMAIDHLRPCGKPVVQAVGRVEHKMGMDMRRPSSAPDRIKLDQVWSGNKFERTFTSALTIFGVASNVPAAANLSMSRRSTASSSEVAQLGKANE